MNGDDASDPLLAEQTQYYIARGAASDDWFYRRGRFDHGPVLNRQWFREAIELVQALANFEPRGKVLEIAGGTGLWTQHLVMTSDRVTVVDVSPESIEASRARLASFTTRVRYVESDIFAWKPKEQFDAIVFAFFLSHIPPERFDAFWDQLKEWLAPGGRVFWIETLRSENALSLDYRLPAKESSVALRRHAGREYHVYKVYQTREALEERLARLGWDVTIKATHEFFLYGWAQPPQE